MSFKKKKGFKRTWLKIAGHISGSECFREIKRGHVIYNILYFQLSVFIWYLERQDLIVTWEIHEMTSCFLVLLSTKHSNSCLWTPDDPQHGMIVRRNLTLGSIRLPILIYSIVKHIYTDKSIGYRVLTSCCNNVRGFYFFSNLKFTPSSITILVYQLSF